jgi:hypothetical protein
MSSITLITTFCVLLFLVFSLNYKFGLLKDWSTATPKPYSYARTQLCWWTLLARIFDSKDYTYNFLFFLKLIVLMCCFNI